MNEANNMVCVPADNAQFTEKLIKLSEFYKRAELAVASKITPQSLQRYFEGSAPRPHTALLLAKALDVDPMWLMDEEQPWREDYPPWPTQSRLNEAADKELLDEVAKRFQQRANWFNQINDQLNSVDWEQVLVRVQALEPGDPLPDDLKNIAEILRMRGMFPHVQISMFQPTSILSRKIDCGELPLIDAETYDFAGLSLITVDQQNNFPALELVLGRLRALNLISDTPGPYEPEKIPTV